ncbi:hypothetical protein EHS25_001525 [Saitozyma podzolica]|uniref:DASH complex subunit DUO1 n=1 Tax=Saitozyma podzolica TaxID=1890683 RepID=A0A427YG92_9TREE|nr:hypothetical protein EHS25_001525 [Saitozyma podzolica]
MDSPLMPTLHGRPTPLSPGSPSALMGDLSLADDSFALPDRPAHASASASGNRNAFAGSQPPTTSHSRTIDGSSLRHSHSQPPATGAGNGNARTKPRFSLFAPQSGGSAVSTGHAQLELDDLQGDPEDPGRGDEGHFGSEEAEGIEVVEDETIHSSRPVQSSEEREDRLRESLYELRQMNEVFDGFLSALEAARGHNERLAARVNQTSALLDQYTALLGQTEHTRQLLSNPAWTGADDDQAALAAAEAARIAAEHAEEERRRLAEERAEEERLRKSEAAAELARARELASRGGARGRGAVRGVRGRGSGIPAVPSRTGAKTPTSTTTPGTGTGLRKPSGGSGGKYGYVQSSGYGPPVRKAA